MKVITKILLGILSAGLVFCLLGFVVAGFDINNMNSGGKYHDVTWDSGTETVKSITILADNADISFVEGEEEGIRLIYSENKRVHYNVSCENGALRLAVVRVPWYKNWSLFNFTTAKITVQVGGMYLTNGSFGYITVKTDNGDIHSAIALRTGAFKIETDNGDVYMNEEVQATSLEVETDNGTLSLAGGAVETTAHFETNNGGVNVRNLQVGSLDVETDNGRVTLENVQTKNSLKVDTDNGDIIMKNVDSQMISVETDNGDVEMYLVGFRENYTVKVRTDNGRKNVENGGSGARELTVVTDNGDVRITFAND